MIFRLKQNSIAFPPVELAEEDGLLAVGGDLSATRLLKAYESGIFPWYSKETPILWYSPHERFVLFPAKVKISKSMKQVLRSGKFNITMNKAFGEVIKTCADIRREGQPGTWITSEMQKAYLKLHELGYAHSVEVWEKEVLVGGLYGVEMGSVFCGESMFNKVRDASKAALIHLCKFQGLTLIDCQIYSEHLERMGAELISRTEYMRFLQKRPE
jgi:leucyl/phenylalanyl-tRNA---protein transferase